MWFQIFTFVDFPMSKLAQPLEHARIFCGQLQRFTKKKQFTGLNTLNRVILVCLNYHTVSIQQSQNFYSDEIEQILQCWFKIRSYCADRTTPCLACMIIYALLHLKPIRQHLRATDSQVVSYWSMLCVLEHAKPVCSRKCKVSLNYKYKIVNIIMEYISIKQYYYHYYS